MAQEIPLGPDGTLEAWEVALCGGPALVDANAPIAVQTWARWHDGRALTTAEPHDPLAAWWHNAHALRQRGLAPSEPCPALEPATLRAYIHALFADTPEPPAHTDSSAIVADHTRLFARAQRDPRTLRTLADRRDLIGYRAQLDIAAFLQDPHKARSVYASALRGLAHCGDRVHSAIALLALAHIACRQQRDAEALPLLHRALIATCHTGDLRTELDVRALLDDTLVTLQRDEARLRALPAWREVADHVGDTSLAAWITSRIAHTAQATGDVSRALAAWREAADRSRAAGDTVTLAEDLRALNELAQRAGQHDLAQRAQDELAALTPPPSS